MIVEKMKSLMKSILFFLSKKQVKLQSDSIGKINLPKNSVSVFSLSTNPIISFKLDGELFFFRECPKTYKKREFLENAIIRFFEFIDQQKVDPEIFKEKIPIKISFSEGEVIGFKEYILTKKNERSFFEKIVRVDRISVKTGFNIWIARSYDSCFFNEYGMGDLIPEFFDIGVLFLWHMRSSLLSFRTQKISTFNGYSFFSAAKSISSKIVAEELGLAHIIVDAKPVYLFLDDVQLFGILTPKAEGYRARDLQISANSLLQKELHDLNWLDRISFQTDHGPDNYNIYCKEKTYYVVAFDNDNQYAFSPLTYITSTAGRWCQRIGSNDGVLCPIIGSNIFNNIINVNFEVLKKRLKPYLNQLQIAALFYRLKHIRKILMRAKERGELTVLNDNDWNDKILQMELKGEFGETYLNILMKVIGQ